MTVNPYRWQRTVDGTDRRTYTLTRNNEHIATTTLNCNLPFHAWILANWCDALWQIERADNPVDRNHLRLVATAADEVQRTRELWTAGDNDHTSHPTGTVNHDNQMGPASPDSDPTPGQTCKEVQRAER